jgi:hypothetical protein
VPSVVLRLYFRLDQNCTGSDMIRKIGPKLLDALLAQVAAAAVSAAIAGAIKLLKRYSAQGRPHSETTGVEPQAANANG